MSNWGMSNRVAATPEQAIDLLAQAAARGAPYDIAIIDLGLPGMDALELARAIRARADIAKVRLVVLDAPPGGHRRTRATRASTPASPSRCARPCCTNAWST